MKSAFSERCAGSETRGGAGTATRPGFEPDGRNANGPQLITSRRGYITAPGLRSENGDFHVFGPATEGFIERDLPIISLIRAAVVPSAVFAFVLLLSLWDVEAARSNYWILAALSSSVAASVFTGVNFYRDRQQYPIGTALVDVLSHWAIVVVIVGVIVYAWESSAPLKMEILAAGAALAPFVLVGAEMSAREVARKLIASRPSRTAVMVGATLLSSALQEKISADAFLNVKAIGFFDDRDEARLPGNAGFRKLGTLADVPEYVKNNAVDTIYLCLPIMWHDRILTLLEKLRDTTASIYYVPDVFMADLVQARIDRIGGMPTIAICETPFIGLKGVAKRLTDIVLSVLLVLVIWPIFLLIAIGIKLTSKGNVLYKQERYGLDGERIVVYKFRTMYERETGGNIIQARPCDDRVTKLGRFLRTTSLDELPQLFNVLRGDMSLVGPRPHAVAHNEMYRNLIKGYMVRHKVKPGITGLAQVNGLRGETDTLDKMQARVDFDLEYLRNWSLTLDALIMLRSVRVILGDSKAY